MDYINVAATGVSITTSSVSANVAIPNTSGGTKPVYIRIAASQPACVKVGVGVQTATLGDMQVQPGDAVVLQIPAGILNIAVIQVAAPGVVQISPLENC